MKRILNKIPSPPGALPARAQTWLLAGLTAVIAITLVTFPGQADKPRSAPSAKLETQGPGSPVGVRSVESAAQRMREEAARTAERRLRTELGVPPPREDGLPHPPVPVPAADDPYRTAGSGHAEAASAEEQIEREESIRRYRSLRTPPLVRSRRDEFAGKPAADGGTPSSQSGGIPETAPPPPEPPSPAVATVPLPEPPEPEAGARPHVLRPGDFLEAVLTNRLSGDFPGPVDAMVSADVYDRSRQHLLVPAGTRAVGEASRVENWEQVRLAVTFRALVFPDGRVVPLGDSPGLNQIGESGLKDKIDRRYGSAIAAAGAVGALAGLSQAMSPQEAFVSRLGSARLSAGSGLSRAAERMLDRYINRLPKVTIREGHRIRIYLTEALELPAYHARRDPVLPRPAGPAAAAHSQGEKP